MITEFVISSGLVWTYNYLKKGNIHKIKKIFNDLMLSENLEYKPIEVFENEYGYGIVVSLFGQGYESLSKLKDLLQSTYGATIDIVQNPNLRTATINIIEIMLSDNYKFKPVKVEPYEFYLGKTYTMKDVIISMKELPHLLVTGINSSGKTFSVISGLVNLIYWNDERRLEIFLSQISIKKRFKKI